MARLVRSRSTAVVATAGVLFGLAACASEPEVVPLTPNEKKAIEALRHFDPKAGMVEDKGTLFMSLDQNLRTWRTLGAKHEVSDMSERESLEYALTAQVYYNFDAILGELEHGTDPEHRVVAAAALGFSRIPAPGEPGGDASFPIVHPRAVKPLVDALESGNDEIVVNALLSLGRIGSPDTPRQILVEMMVKHHQEDVRANAALALAELATPADTPLLLSPLIGAVSDPSAKVRLHAVIALGRLSDRSAQGPLLDRLRRDTSPLVQACAAAQLRKVGDATAVKYLIEALKTDSPLVNYECRKTLVELTHHADFPSSSADRTQQMWKEWWETAEVNPERHDRT